MRKPGTGPNFTFAGVIIKEGEESVEEAESEIVKTPFKVKKRQMTSLGEITI